MTLFALRHQSRTGIVSAALLAHQGGWDEILLVLGPIIAISGLLVIAKRRVDRAADERDAAQLDEAQRDASQRDGA